jgi:predicted transcriptional regulator
MTNDVTDMLSPVTRGELREELAQFEHRIDDKIDDKFDRLERKFDDKIDRLERKFDDKIDRLERKFDNNLGLWGGALAAQISELAAQMRESETRMLNELARHSQAGFESMTTRISAVDEKYNDLPARVARLEVNALK